MGQNEVYPRYSEMQRERDSEHKVSTNEDTVSIYNIPILVRYYCLSSPVVFRADPVHYTVYRLYTYALLRSIVYHPLSRLLATTPNLDKFLPDERFAIKA